MRVSARRLEKLEAGLTPKQHVLRWLDHAFSFGSEEAYTDWLVSRSMSELPRIKLAETVADAARSTHRGAPREAVEQAVLRAVRDVYFLTQLVVDMNTLVGAKAEVFSSQAAVCARGLQLLVLREMAWGRTGRPAAACSWAVNALGIRREIEAFAAEVYTVQEMVGVIARHYFNN